MFVIPAIDLKNGKCVRLLQGRFDQETVYGNDPAAMAQKWDNLGAGWIHLVDLDGSLEKKPVNQAAILSIRDAVQAKLELGGGIRDLETISFYLDKGVDRIILGTAALRNPDLVKAAAEKFPGQIALGIDAHGSEVVVEAWTEKTGRDFIEMAQYFEGLGVSALIYTDVERDGTQTGPNLERTKHLAESVNIPVIASGGIKDLEDIRKLLTLEPCGVIGAITGKALYDGTLDFERAIELSRP